MKGQSNKKKYKVWHNIIFCCKKLQEHRGKKYFVLLPFELICAVVVPLLFAVLPSIVIKLLLSEWGVGAKVMSVVGYATLLCGMQFLLKRVENHVSKETFFYRLSMGVDFAEKIVAIPYEVAESIEGKQTHEKARTAVFSGQNVGLEGVMTHLSKLLMGLLGLGVYALITISLHPALMVLLVLCPLGRLWVSRKNIIWKERHKDEWSAVDRKIYYLQKECLELKNGKDIRMYQIENWFVELFQNLIGKRVGWYKKELIGKFNAQLVDRSLTMLRDICCYGYLIIQVLNGMNIAQFTMYLGIIAGFGDWIQKIFESSIGLLDNNIIVNDYRKYMEQQPYWEIGGEAPLPKGKTHTITLEQVDFAYPGSDIPIFENLNLTIRKGEKLAIVGMNGSGKSTLIKLICGLYQPQKGRILIDGQDRNTFNLREYYELFSVVFQDVFAFAFPVRDNITCGVTQACQETWLEECITMAGLGHKIQTLPQGIDTNMLKDLDDDGINLSGGELQKLMLARALYKDAPIVILDEPTAALDPLAELEMYEKYNAFIQGKTSVFISHRLSSTVFCDRVIYLEAGKIIEEGTHESLMAQKGAYAKMYELQAHYYQEEVEGHVC